MEQALALLDRIVETADPLGLKGPGPTYVRDLAEADLPALAGSRTPAPTPIARLRHQHHLLAKLLAEDVPKHEASLLSGYSVGGIASLESDPAFQDLVATYRMQQKAIDFNIHRRLEAFGADCLQELQQRLEEHPELITVPQLKDLVDMAFSYAIAAKGKGPSGGSGGGTVFNVKFVTPDAPGVVIDQKATTAE